MAKGDSWKPSAEEQALLDALEAPLPTVPVSAAYRLALAVVTLAMVALPLIYLGLIGLAAYVVYWHASANLHWLEAAGWVSALAYLAPLVVGVILVLFMVKPLFAPRPEATEPMVVTAEDEPFLHAFVKRLARAVGAPWPREIRVDCEPNASAAFRRGILSFARSDLVLTVGLPLVVGLRLSQLGGVLAHELGHFAQRAGMRLTYVIRWVSLWFARVVYTRDTWDQGLVRASHSFDLRVGFMLWIARFFVWLTRRVLWILMMIGHLISGLMLRQMELDADRYETHLAGSETFTETSLALPRLAVATQMAQEDLGDLYYDGRLADNLPALVASNSTQLPEELLEHLETHLREERRSVLSSHPATRDRIASAQTLAAPGRLAGDTPATVLFHDLDGICRRATLDYYQAVLGGEALRVSLVPVDQFISQRGALLDELRAAQRIFLGFTSTRRALPLPLTPLPQELPKHATWELESARAELLRRYEDHRGSLARMASLHGRRVVLAQTRALLQAGLQIQPEDWPLANPTWRGVSAEDHDLATEQPRVEASLVAGEQAAARRLWIALGQHVQGLSPVDRAHVESLIQALRLISGLLPEVLLLDAESQALLTLARELGAHGDLESLSRATIAQMDRTRDQLVGLVSALGDAPYPLDHAKGKMTLWEHLAPDRPAEGDLGALLDASLGAVSRALRLHERLLGQLAAMVEAAELALGLEPLPEPPPPESTEDGLT